MHPQYQPPPMPEKKGTPVWVWVAAAVAGLALLVVIALAATGYFIYRQAKDVASNPTAAIAKVVAMTNPNIEVLSVDDAKGTVTIKDKESGKTVTMSLDELKNGKLEVKSEEGTVSIGAGADTKTPKWVPLYPGAKSQSLMSAQTPEGDSGTVTLEAKEEFSKVKAWYEEQIAAGGFPEKYVTAGTGSEGQTATLTASRNDHKDTMTILFNTEPEFTRVTITFYVKK